MVTRREFLEISGKISLGAVSGLLFSGLQSCLPDVTPERLGKIMTVDGLIEPGQLGVLVDFVGPENVSPSRYDRKDAVLKIMPHVEMVRRRGCDTMVECTPAYMGRNPSLLRQLRTLTGMQFITNTGYYGAADDKYLPEFVFEESSEDLAERWIREYQRGMDDSEYFPGVIKIGIDSGAISAIDEKLVVAAALTHLQTGMTIASHTGGNEAIIYEMRVLEELGVHPQALIWVHAQNEENPDVHLEAADRGVWVEYDDIHPDRIEAGVERVVKMKEAGYFNQLLVSHDAGWYTVGEEDGGDFRSYMTIYDDFIPALLAAGISAGDVQQLTVNNPREAFTLRFRRG